MSDEVLTPETLRGREVADRRFDPRSAAPFVYKSTSEETRRAYRRTLLEFFRFVEMRHPGEVVPAEVLRWRDQLRSQKKSAATVAFKLSVVRSFFEHLRAGRSRRAQPGRDEAGAAAGSLLAAGGPRSFGEGGALPAGGA